jgi:hypothetical protein
MFSLDINSKGSTKLLPKIFKMSSLFPLTEQSINEFLGDMLGDEFGGRDRSRTFRVKRIEAFSKSPINTKLT